LLGDDDVLRGGLGFVEPETSLEEGFQIEKIASEMYLWAFGTVFGMCKLASSELVLLKS